MRVVLLALLCASGVASAETAKTEHTKWQGTYTCAQGPTGVNLTIDESCDGKKCSVTAIFEFGAIKENPDLPHGSFRMTGESDGTHYALHPDAWIEQPPGWIMVGVTATKDDAHHTMSGRMEHPSCGEIHLKTVR
ncbi:MAG TPA: hypothetical protein VGF94_24650 [Kofleriaceae bacterium]|jgi:hypothetical protein